MLELRPMLSAIWRNKISALLIALQLALTLAIISNAAVIVGDRADKMKRPTGMAVDDIISLTFLAIPQDYDMSAAVTADMALLREMPGVMDAAPSNQLPLSGSGSASGYHTKPNEEIGGEGANQFQSDSHFINALGMKLVAGRNFTEADMHVVGPNDNYTPSIAIVTQQFADTMYPEGNALGKYFYGGGDDHPIEIVGIVERNLGSWVNWNNAGNVVVFPTLVVGNFKRYVIRAEPGQRDDVLKRVEDVLAERDPRRVFRIETMSHHKARSYAGDNTMVMVLSAVMGLLTFIVALGIIGLTFFWINQRRKQIGVRRALGATRTAISRYFLLENLIIAGTGIALGLAAAQIFNHMMVSSFKQPPLTLPVMLACALILLSVSIVAALVPALRAANISPATATRSV
ncbi:ABC transporter permease [Microbulbifer hainanensis]|uniref:ABC transporter permease n=1 Tax=Microbulbifer hainanensis TaxID=2735675 RepID=UPI001866BD09|nr:FtsX-like permease family protein [Microbulbifer hainanensis]